MRLFAAQRVFLSGRTTSALIGGCAFEHVCPFSEFLLKKGHVYNASSGQIFIKSSISRILGNFRPANPVKRAPFKSKIAVFYYGKPEVVRAFLQSSPREKNYACATSRNSRISASRFFCDGVKRTNGFTPPCMKRRMPYLADRAARDLALSPFSWAKLKITLLPSS